MRYEHLEQFSTDEKIIFWLQISWQGVDGTSHFVYTGGRLYTFLWELGTFIACIRISINLLCPWSVNIVLTKFWKKIEVHLVLITYYFFRALGPQNLLLRGARLKNSTYTFGKWILLLSHITNSKCLFLSFLLFVTNVICTIVGVAVYTGRETKVRIKTCAMVIILRITNINY